MHRINIWLFFSILLFNYVRFIYTTRHYSEYEANGACADKMQQRGYITADKAKKRYTIGPQRDFIFPNMTLIGDSTITVKKKWLDFINKSQSVILITSFYQCNKLKNLIHSSSGATDMIQRENEIVIWNIGLHTLHLRPYRDGPYHEIEEYRNEFHCMAAIINEIFNQSRIFYKLTNTICAEKYNGKYAIGAHQWQDTSEHVLRSDYSLQFTRIGTENLNTIERELATYYNYTLLNTYTNGMCACTPLQDGRHYLPLVPHFWEMFLSLLQKKKETK